MAKSPFVVLVIEDDPAYQGLVEEVGRVAGVSCSFVTSGGEALRVIETIQPALLLIDYNLGDMDASELLGKLQLRNLLYPFVIMTGFGSEETAVDMMKMGALDYVIKDNIFLKRLSVALRSAKDTVRMQQELQTTQRELKEHRDYFRSFLEQSRDIVVLLDGQGRIQQTNPTFRTETGFLDDHSGLFFKELLETDSHAVFDAMFAAALSMQAPEPHEVNLRDKNNEFIPVDIVITPLPDTGEGEYIVMGRVLRERKKLEEQLRQSQKMQAVGRLAGGIAHDFNNILTTIFGFAELIAEIVPQDSEIVEYISEVSNAAQRATDLTNQLLLFSRRQVMKPRVLQLNGFLLEMRKMMERLLSEDIRLSFDLASELMVVKVDHGQLSQVMLNLVVNARDAMPDGGKLLVRTQNVVASNVPQLATSLQEWYVHLSVSDTGVGMSPEVRKQIFDPFYTTKEAGKGTGLGLAVVYGIVSQHNGYIDVESDEGFGSTFHIYLPAMHHQVRRDVEKASPSRIKLQGAGQTVLVVEDEPRVRNIAERILQRNNYKVVSAVSMADALSMLDELDEGIDLVFTDVVLGDGSGIDLARIINTGSTSKSVLLTSGYTSERSQLDTIHEEGFPYLQKPYSAMELLQAVNDALGRS